jgi:hypothetical protein
LPGSQTLMSMDSRSNHEGGSSMRYRSPSVVRMQSLPGKAAQPVESCKASDAPVRRATSPHLIAAVAAPSGVIQLPLSRPPLMAGYQTATLPGAAVHTEATLASRHSASLQVEAQSATPAKNPQLFPPPTRVNSQASLYQTSQGQQWV